MQNKTLAKTLFSDTKMKYLQNDEHKILQGFQGTHVTERICTHQFIKSYSKLEFIIIYSRPRCAQISMLSEG